MNGGFRPDGPDATAEASGPSATQLAQTLLDRARDAGISIVTAESCTAGLVAATITAVPGSSTVFDRGFVTYSNPAKAEMLGVPVPMIAAFGAVSEQVAMAMARGALTHSRAGLAVAVTGVAGPGGSDYKPEGRVCLAVALRGAPPQVETRDFGPLGRDAVRHASVIRALELLLATIP